MYPQRTSNIFQLRDSYVFSDYPIHFAGAALFLYNSAPAIRTDAWATPDATAHTYALSIEESDDGVTYSPVQFSTPTEGGQLTDTIVGQGLRAVLFTSAS